MPSPTQRPHLDRMTPEEHRQVEINLETSRQARESLSKRHGTPVPGSGTMSAAPSTPNDLVDARTLRAVTAASNQSKGS